MTAETLRDQIHEIVCELLGDRATPPPNEAHLSLLELGLDSLTVIDLAVALEDRLGIDYFPIQEWSDAEAALDGPRFTLASLARECERLLSTGGERP